MPFATNTILIRFLAHKTNSVAEMSLEDVSEWLSTGLGARAGAAEAARAQESLGLECRALQGDVWAARTQGQQVAGNMFPVSQPSLKIWSGKCCCWCLNRDIIQVITDKRCPKRMRPATTLLCRQLSHSRRELLNTADGESVLFFR